MHKPTEGYLTQLARSAYVAMCRIRCPERFKEWEELTIQEQDGWRAGVIAILEDLDESRT